MNELQQLTNAWDLVERRGGQAVLATLVKTSGSTYRRPGARMLMSEDGRLAGAISGGCLEGDLARRAWWRTSDGQATIVRYDSTGEDDEVRWGFGLGCNGTLDVLLERLVPGSDVHPLTFVRRCQAAREPGVMATVIGSSLNGRVRVGERLMCSERGSIASTVGDRALASRVEHDARTALATGESSHHVYDGGAIEVFVETILPPRPLVIFGNGFDVAPLLELAKQLGWHVTIVEARASPAARFAAADRVLVAPASELERVLIDARTAVVIMSHNYDRDLAVLARALQSPAPYVGMLGPLTRTERLIQDLARAGVAVTPAQRARLHGPVGLDLGAEGPVEIALAIVAEIQVVLARRTGASLREASSRPRALAAP